MNKKLQKGFTLIELMIVVAIIAIISAIALPSYTGYVQKAKRSDAKVELLRIAQLQESYFVQNLSYAQDLTSTSANGGLDMGATVLSEQEEYEIKITKVPAACDGLASGTACTGYTLTADATGRTQASDVECGNFTLTNTGAKGITGTGTSRTCWR